MDLSFSLFVILGFVAVVLLLEGVFVYWNDTRSPEVRTGGARCARFPPAATQRARASCSRKGC